MHIHNYVQQYMECERGGGGGDRTPEAIWGLWGMGGGGGADSTD